MFLVDLVTFTEKILNGKLHFLCSAFDDQEKDMKDLYVTKPKFSASTSGICEQNYCLI